MARSPSRFALRASAKATGSSVVDSNRFCSRATSGPVPSPCSTSQTSTAGPENTAVRPISSAAQGDNARATRSEREMATSAVLA